MRIANFGILIVATAMAHGVASAAAHEFWVAPQRYTVKPGDPIVAPLVVGRMMKGVSLPYISSNFRSFTITTRNGTRKVRGFEGDLPALSYTAKEPGLHVIAHHTTAKQITYDSWEKFTKYLALEGLKDIAKAHHARGLLYSGFTESYTRCAKALVQVGPVGARDLDAPRGLPLELIAVENPYSQGLKTLAVTLLRMGKPVAGRQITVFRYDGKVSRTIVSTDAGGRASISLAGGGSFLLNAVDFQPVKDGTAVWASHWATLTFGISLRK